MWKSRDTAFPIFCFMILYTKGSFVMSRKKRNKWYEQRLSLKIFICMVYLIVITILLVCAYRLYEKKEEILPWAEVSSVDDYSYIEVSKMSEKFAYYSAANKEVHFVIEQEDTGLWHTYLIAIDSNDYDKFKDIIDYTYERTTVVPKPVKVYGYPVIIDDDLKQLAIKNIVNFVPAENEVVVTNENFATYLTNSYLDTTLQKEDNFSALLLLVLIILVIVIVLLIFTIFNKDRIVDEAYTKFGQARKKKRHIFSIKK